MEKSNLEIAIDWIFAHVATEDARRRLHYVIRQQTAAYGADVYVAYTAIVFTYQEKMFSTRAAILAEVPRQAEYVLLDLHRELGLPIDFEYYQAPGKHAETFDPVGDEWPDKTKEFGRTCYYVGRQGLAAIHDGMPWDSKSKGLVYAMSGSSWFGLKTIWFWVKANA